MPDPARPRRLPWRLYAGGLAAILIVTLAPVASVLLATLIADIYGCRLDEANAYPCIINGFDWGVALSMMFVMGWLMLATLPLGATALIVWLGILLVHLFMSRTSKQA